MAPVTSSAQHRRRGQPGVVLIKAGHSLPLIDGHPLGDARRDPQHLALAAFSELPTVPVTC